MQDLLPEAWLSLADNDIAKCCSTSVTGGRKRHPPVTNIFTWLQGFASLVSTLSTKYPGMVPEFLVYQSTIIKCYKDYDGLGWVQYDRAFRRQPRTSTGPTSTEPFTACVSQGRQNAALYACIAPATTTHLSAAPKLHPPAKWVAPTVVRRWKFAVCLTRMEARDAIIKDANSLISALAVIKTTLGPPAP